MRVSHPAWVLLFAGVALAQPAPTPSPSEPQEPEAPRSEYSGPALLSRGFIPSLRQITELVRLRPFADVSGTYDSGLTPISLTSSGEIPSRAAYGAQVSFGASGYHSWRRSVLAMQYVGRFRHYSRYRYHDGLDQHLSLNLAHQVSSRVTVVLTPAVASYSRGFFLPVAGSDYYNPELASVIGNELFDNRVHAVVVSGRLIYQRTARLSFSLGGSGFTVKRQSSALVGVYGYRSNGDVAYRLSRYQSIAVDYSFQHYEYRNYFGSADVHGAGLSYSVQMGRYWTLGLRAGGYRVEVSGLERVALDPVIMAITGLRYAVSTGYHLRYVPGYEAGLTRRFQNGSLSLNYSRSISPGNGLYLTSGRESASVGYNYTGMRRASVGFSAGMSTQKALVQDLPSSRGYTAGMATGYGIGHGLSLSGYIGARHYDIHSTAFKRLSYHASVGLAFSPGEVPFSLW